MPTLTVLLLRRLLSVRPYFYSQNYTFYDTSLVYDILNNKGRQERFIDQRTYIFPLLIQFPLRES